MVECMWAAEEAGLPIVLTIHDELVCEVDEDDPDALKTLLEIMHRPPSFAPDWPAAAEGWEGKRYRK
jgi:DNA polymerase